MIKKVTIVIHNHKETGSNDRCLVYPGSLETVDCWTEAIELTPRGVYANLSVSNYSNFEEIKDIIQLVEKLSQHYFSLKSKYDDLKLSHLIFGLKIRGAKVTYCWDPSYDGGSTTDLIPTNRETVLFNLL